MMYRIEDYPVRVYIRLVLLMLPLLLLNPVSAAQENVFILSSAQWNVPRTTQSVIGMPAIRQAVKAYEETPLATIQLRYAGGDEGTLWANELRSWLVALGIASADIDLLPGAKQTDQLEIRVVSNPLRSRPAH